MNLIVNQIDYGLIKVENFTENLCKNVYLPYLNNFVDQCNNTYHYSTGRKRINADYSALTEKNEANSKAPKFKVNNKVKITKYKNTFSKGYTENWSR